MDDIIDFLPRLHLWINNHWALCGVFFGGVAVVGKTVKWMANSLISEPKVSQERGLAASYKYLVEIQQDREDEAVETLFGNPIIIQRFFHSLGLDSCSSWCLLRIKEKRLGISSDSDVDVLAGRLTWKEPDAFTSQFSEEARMHPEYPSATQYELAARALASTGGIQWPPQTDYLVAIEAKSAYRFGDELKSTKIGKVPRIRGKVKALLQMGFDRVALLDIIANPPTAGANG